MVKDGNWACCLTLAMICYGIWDLPFYLAIGDTLFGTYRIAHRIGGLFVVCGCSMLMCGYSGVSFHGVLCYVSRRYLIYAWEYGAASSSRQS